MQKESTQCISLSVILNDLGFREVKKVLFSSIFRSIFNFEMFKYESRNIY